MFGPTALQIFAANYGTRNMHIPRLTGACDVSLILLLCFYCEVGLFFCMLFEPLTQMNIELAQQQILDYNRVM